MPFVKACAACKALFQEKEKKEKGVAKPQRKKCKRTQQINIV
jgi:hypothetical protein